MNELNIRTGVKLILGLTKHAHIRATISIAIYDMQPYVPRLKQILFIYK